MPSAPALSGRGRGLFAPRQLKGDDDSHDNAADAAHFDTSPTGIVVIPKRMRFE